MSSERPASLTPPPSGYAEWLLDLKQRIHTAQQRAALAVNRELVGLYWSIGSEIWRAKVIDRLAHDLRTAFPDLAIVQQAVGQLPWGHNLDRAATATQLSQHLKIKHGSL